MKIFLAGSYSAKDELKVIRAALEDQGHEVTSTWLDEPANTDTSAFSMKLYALNDIFDLERADLVAIMALWPSTTGGWYTELGIALARGIETYVVGNVGTTGVYVALPSIKRLATAEEFIEEMGDRVPTHTVTSGFSQPQWLFDLEDIDADP